MKTSILFLLTCSCVPLSFAAAQDDTAPPLGPNGSSFTAPPAPKSPSNIANPFEVVPNQGGDDMMGMDGGMGMGIGEMSGYGMEVGMGEMGGMEDMYGGDMGGMGSGMYGGMSDEQLFRHRLRNAITRIGDAKSEDEKTTLMRYTQTALQERYDQMIARRKKDLERLKQSLAKLEADLQKREAAKDRVVKLQMQSAILAAEGLLDLNSLQPTPPGMGGYSGMEMGGGLGN